MWILQQGNEYITSVSEFRGLSRFLIQRHAHFNSSFLLKRHLDTLTESAPELCLTCKCEASYTVATSQNLQKSLLALTGVLQRGSVGSVFSVWIHTNTPIFSSYRHIVVESTYMWIWSLVEGHSVYVEKKDIALSGFPVCRVVFLWLMLLRGAEILSLMLKVMAVEVIFFSLSTLPLSVSSPGSNCWLPSLCV